eukprot:7805700-Lingulodinium_polyedra.AAC.1
MPCKGHPWLLHGHCMAIDWPVNGQWRGHDVAITCASALSLRGDYGAQRARTCPLMRPCRGHGKTMSIQWHALATQWPVNGHIVAIAWPCCGH